jgi:hypothetical protein
MVSKKTASVTPKPVAGSVGSSKIRSVNNRPFTLFLSHADVDKGFADHLYRWCTDFAEMQVWYDAENLRAGQQIAAALARAIVDCQSAIVVLSESSLRSEWVKKEWNICMYHRAKYPDFAIIPIRIDQSEPPLELESERWIDIENGQLTPAAAVSLLAALHGNVSDPKTIGYKPVYLARGSHPHEVQVGRYISAQLEHYQFRSVRDAPNEDFILERIEALMSGCIGAICVLSHRGQGKTSKYFFDEMRVARKLGLPILAFIEEAVKEDLSEWEDVISRRVPQLDPFPESILDEGISDFSEYARQPAPRPAYCFLGHAFKEEQTKTDSKAARTPSSKSKSAEPEFDRKNWEYVRRGVEVVTGLPCISGDAVKGGGIQEQIIERIRNATFCLFDISNNRLNSCIEAGMAIGARTPFELVCRGPRRSPDAFMFRTTEVWYYDTPAELVGLVRRLALPYRRVMS